MIEKLENFIEPIREITYKSEDLLDRVKRNGLQEFYTYIKLKRTKRMGKFIQYEIWKDCNNHCAFCFSL